jgi:hypothetical protein
MRRVLLTLALVVMALVPSPVAAAQRCTLTVSPAVVGPADGVDITVRGVPTGKDGAPTEVGIDVRRLGTHEGAAYFVTPWFGQTEVSVRHHYDYSGENPLAPMAHGRYLVKVSTPHLHGGCHATGMFVVVEG